MSILSDSNIKDLPVLFLFDNFKYELLDSIEKLRTDISNGNNSNISEKNVNYLFISLKNEIGNISIGLDWLGDVMKPLDF